MAVDVSAQVTSTWPSTEAKLGEDSGVDYATQKAKAIARAKRSLYGSGSVPSSESDIPEQAAYWIADQAVVYLIPLAKSWYIHNRKLSDSKEGATTSYYDAVRMLEQLKGELEAGLVRDKEDALTSISSARVDDDVPAVSHKGMIVDPVERAFYRGPW
jgi:hypothetical protein